MACVWACVWSGIVHELYSGLLLASASSALTPWRCRPSFAATCGAAKHQSRHPDDIPRLDAAAIRWAFGQWHLEIPWRQQNSQSIAAVCDSELCLVVSPRGSGVEARRTEPSDSYTAESASSGFLLIWTVFHLPTAKESRLYPSRLHRKRNPFLDDVPRPYHRQSSSCQNNSPHDMHSPYWSLFRSDPAYLHLQLRSIAMSLHLEPLS